MSNSYIIDASGQSLGRVASQAAKLLRGKNEVDFERHHQPAVKVTVINASKIKISPKKLTEKVYDWYSGYPGGRRQQNLGERIKAKGLTNLLTQTVKGMIPSNKLKTTIIKQLTVTE